MNFGDLLTADQKRELLEAKIQQLAVEGYQLQINRSAIKDLENSEATLEILDTNMKTIFQAISSYQQELANLQ